MHNKGLPEGRQIWIGLDLTPITIIPTVYQTQLADGRVGARMRPTYSNATNAIHTHRVRWIAAVASRTATAYPISATTATHAANLTLDVALTTTSRLGTATL